MHITTNGELLLRYTSDKTEHSFCLVGEGHTPTITAGQDDEYSLLQVEPIGYDPNNSDYSHLDLSGNDRVDSPPPPTPPVRHSSKQNSNSGMYNNKRSRMV